MKTKSKVLLAIALVLLLAGLCILLYPFFFQWLDRMEISSQYDDFKAVAESIQNTPHNTGDTTETTSSSETGSANTGSTKPLQLDRLYKDMAAYNDGLIKNGQGVLDPFLFAQTSFDLTQYGIEDEIFGFISAPAIDMKIPIYLGASETNMARGAGTLTQTSVPIGGTSTNSVFAAHTGMIRQTMFDNIVNLKQGDDVYILNYWDELHYKVIDTFIILPTESSHVLIEKDRDLITMLTCYPYGYNSKRYVVVCQRVT